MEKKKPWLQEIDEQRESVGRELCALYERAGVMDKVQRVGEWIAPDFWRDKSELTAPIGTELRRQQLREQEDKDSKIYRNGIRDVVFRMIPDAELRKEVIKAERRAWALKLQWFAESARESRARLDKLESSTWHGLSVANALVPMVVVAFVAYGSSVRATIIAVAFAVVYIVSSAINGNNSLRSAKVEVENSDSLAKDVEREPEPFSYHEEVVAEADDQDGAS